MDIEEKLQSAEQSLAAKVQLLQATAKLFTDPIFVLDRHGKCLEVIGGSEWSLYRSGKFLLGKYLHDHLPAELSDLFMLAITGAIEEKSLKTFEYLFGAEDFAASPVDSPKGRQWFEARIYPLKEHENEINSVIWLPVNITLRKNLEEQITDLSARDTLTKAFNRRHFIHIFEKEFRIAKRYRTRLSILLIAIDRLKDINDAYGQETGDAVLKRFTIFCESTLRDSDLFARYGGAEFIAMLPNTPSLGAAIIAERIRAHVEQLEIPYEKEMIRFTISMGISEVLDNDASSNAVITRADAALYEAKKKGRNRIEIN